MSMKFNEIEEQSGLHDQMIMDEILSRLPVKSLCRFKCVSKHWKAMISSHEFVKFHLRKQQELVSLPISNPKWVFFQQKQNSWLLNYEVYDHEEVSTLDKDHSGALVSLGKVFDTQLINKADPESFGSSCGLVCMFDYEKGQLFLFNPSLRKWRLIPKPEPFSPENPMFWGFGYVSFIDDFKLILGFKDWSEAQSIMIFVFSLRNNSWRKVEGDHHFDTIAASHMYAKGILVNEHVHWWATPIDEKDHHNGGCIMAFDLVHETFEKIHVPFVLRSKVPNLFNSSDSNHISSKGGHVCLSVVREKNVEIWMLKQYRTWDSWVRLCDLHIPGSDEYCHQFLEFTKTGKFLMRCSMSPDGLNVSHVIFLVDQNQSTHKNNPIWSDGPISCIESYVESLVSPFGLATHGPTSM